MHSWLVVSSALGAIVASASSFAPDAQAQPAEAARASSPSTSPFDPPDGARIVFLGNTLIERDQSRGYWEARLSRRWPDRHLIFRNLAWSGDTVFGDARAGFETATEGYQRLVQQVRGVEPTQIFIAYGGVEAFEGEAGLPKFRDGLNRLLDDLAKTRAGVEMILLTPPPQERLGPPYPDPRAQNERLKLYSHAILEIAEGRKLRSIDLFRMLGGPGLTSNGVHLHENGYATLGEIMERALGLKRLVWRAEFGGQGQILTAPNLEIDNVKRTSDRLSFRARSKRLVAPPTAWADFDERNLLAVADLPLGEYMLKIDGQETDIRGDFAAWGRGVAFWRSPDSSEFEALRQTVIRKNLLYFYRWRPQNETYLFGFRKHEQGNNAREVPMFDPLVVEQETRIAQFRGASKPHQFELVRIGDQPKLAPDSGDHR